MKKKFIMIAPLVIALVAILTFFKPVQTFALDALSIFRVSDVKTIKITVADLQESMQKIKDLQGKVTGQSQELKHDSFVNIISSEKPEMKELADKNEFEGFRLRLPEELEGKTPKIASVEAHVTKFSLNIEACNQALSVLGSPALPNSLNGVEISMNVPASAAIQYDDLFLFATQKPVLEAPKAAKEALQDTVLQTPLIPSNIRQQLAEIDMDSSDVYLPVLVGVGREVDLGGRTGYIYTMSDLQGFIGSLPADLQLSGATDLEKKNELAANHGAQLTEEEIAAIKVAHEQADKGMPNLENASLLIWTKDGILYALAGDKTDAELVKIARSVH